MKNKNKAIWGTRFNNIMSKTFEEIGSSIDVDKRLFEEDIAGSIVHTQMLSKQKIIDKKKAIKIIKGLKRIKSEINKNKFNFRKKYEDIHLNIEKRLFEEDIHGSIVHTKMLVKQKIINKKGVRK